MPSKKVQEEKQHHKEAYEIYYLLPQDKRSIREVARVLKKAPSTIQSWAESFNWKERVEIRDAQVSKQFQQLQAQNDETLVSIKASFHKILKALIADAIDRIKKKHLGIDDVKELVKVMEFDLKLLGEEDRAAQNQFQSMLEAIQASTQLFGNNETEWTYDGKDRPEGDDNDTERSE